MQPTMPLAGRPSIVPSELKAIIHKKRQPEERSFRQVLTTFIKERYSGHGLRKLLTNDSLPRKIIWLLVFLVCVGFACCHAAGVVVEYFHGPVTSKMKVEMSSRVVFPAVTICHQDPLDFTRADEDSDGPTEAMETYSDMSKIQFYLDDPEEVCKDTSTAAALADKLPTDVGDVTKLRNWMSIFSNQANTLGFSYKEVVHACSFNGMLCNEEHFHESTHFKYGKCYTFNSNTSTTSSVKDTLKYGMANGLKLVLKQSMEGRKRTIAYRKGGFRISIHSPDVSPFPEEDGYDIASGEEVTNIGVKSKAFYRLNMASKQCAHSQLSGTVYSHAGCRAMCYDAIIREKCQCTRLTEDFQPDNVDPCDYTNSDHRTCLETEMKKMQDSSLCPECHAPCMERVYEMSVMSAKRHRDVKMLELARRIRDHEDCEDKELDFGKYELMDVNVYLENIIRETHEEVYARTMSDLVLHIGAMLALFLGFSLVVVLEFIELIVDFFILCCCKGNRVDPDDDVVSEEVMIRYHGFPFAFSNMVAGQAKRTSQSSVMSENIIKNIEVMNCKETKDPWGYY